LLRKHFITDFFKKKNAAMLITKQLLPFFFLQDWTVQTILL